MPLGVEFRKGEPSKKRGPTIRGHVGVRYVEQLPSVHCFVRPLNS